MMIARVGEFADVPVNHSSQNQDESDDDSKNNATDWKQQKSDIIKYTNSIQYRARDEWHQELKNAGFHLIATLDYDLNGSNNPQALFYAVYQLKNK
jgi:hypothetical protein